MKSMWTILLMISVVCTSWAQTKPATNDPEAKKVLDAVSAKFKTFKTLKSTFTYKVENAQGKVLSTKNGTVYMKGNKYRVSFVGQEIFCDGSNVWTYDNSANEVTITKLDASGNSITPQKLFTNFYDKDFLYKLNGEKKVGTKTIQEIEMTPTDKTRPFHKVYISVDKAAKTISSTKVLEKAGSTYVYSVNTMTPNTTLADTLFVFDVKKYPGVEVIDLR